MRARFVKLARLPQLNLRAQTIAALVSLRPVPKTLGVNFFLLPFPENHVNLKFKIMKFWFLCLLLCCYNARCQESEQSIEQNEAERREGNAQNGGNGRIYFEFVLEF